MADAPELRGSHAPGGVAEARAAMLAWFSEGGAAGREFLEAHLLEVTPGRFRVRHRDDTTRDAGELTCLDDPFAAREIAQTTQSGEHRPLKTAPNLRRGWSFESLDGAGLWTVLDYLYPACAVHWQAGRAGTLRVTHWRDTAARQSGIYSAVGLLPEPALRRAVRACCGDAVCLRRVAWGVSPEDPEPIATDPEPAAGGGTAERVPCPEACSMMISFARTVLSLERLPRREVPGLGPMSDAELAQLREVARAAADGTLGATREGEFDEPTNLRRIRYLAARFADPGPGAGPA